ncbi:MAG: hypothetical protein KJ593_07740 [Candidatus Omnitrophica bacterium]|nr:hypothetical protein [Candidatus Omnitrophota bacterium]
MNLLLFIVAIIISFIAVRIGAIAFQLTGLEWSLAKFQALSCFTGTGFTTKEAESITGNPQRRRIASVLMVLGNAGLVTLIATFANSLRVTTVIPKFTIPILHLVLPVSFLPLVNLAIILISVYVIYKVFTRTKFARKLTDFLRRNIVKKELVKPVSFEELVVATGGYGISQIEICKDSPIKNKTIMESDLRVRDINVLAIEREGATIPNPSANEKFNLGDRIICFGKLENIRKAVCLER